MTTENQKLVADVAAVKKLRWKCNPDLDPQLVWRGKDFEADSLEVDLGADPLEDRRINGSLRRFDKGLVRFQR